MREPENIQQVTELGIDLMGFIFWPKSPRYVKSVTVKAGIVPNLPNSKVTRNAKKVKRVGVFVDEMPQTIITHAYNYRLDYIQLHGNESPIYIENLKRTLIPDILSDVKIIKANAWVAAANSLTGLYSINTMATFPSCSQAA